ncbi:MAG: malonyl-CoA decarboxylase family protein [Gammaproteobacteria bacterium]|nr:malonyl-CoA decarboxylase family protein [Gammaproteobacteria bacterium]MDP7456157.1 malonyl-CoA decarboxylase family protein [Gammaproteobacteria bacterium]
MAFGRFQDFLGGLVKLQRRFYFTGDSENLTVDELLDKLMANTGEVSAIVAARELLNRYNVLDDDEKLAFFTNLEQNFNADQASVREAFNLYDNEPNSLHLNQLSRIAEPRRQELLRRLNQTPGATSDLVSMRADLRRQLKSQPELNSVDDDFVRLFSSWFGRGFLLLQTIDWSTSAAILERIIRYEAVHEIRDWDDLRQRIDPENRRCFAFFHPALEDEPLIFVEVALSRHVPESINEILEDSSLAGDNDFDSACFYSISNCQPGLKHISFGNFLIKQVVQELQSEFPGMKQFVTLSPIPGLCRWLEDDQIQHNEQVKPLIAEIAASPKTEEGIGENPDLIRQLAAAYLLLAKKNIYPRDPVARFHLGNGARVHEIRVAADLSEKGLEQSRGAMVNYMYDLKQLERNHEQYITEGIIEHSDKLKSLVGKLKE